MDEMEKQHSLVAIKWSWTYMLMFLAVWAVIEFIQTRNITMPGLLFVSQGLVYIVAQQVLAHKTGDEQGKKTLVLVSVCVGVLLLAGIVMFLHFGNVSP